MEVKLIIPRQPYGNLQRPGAGRIGDVRLSPEGMAALERLTTCSRGAVIDLALQVLDAIASGDEARLKSVARDLWDISSESFAFQLADNVRELNWEMLGVKP